MVFVFRNDEPLSAWIFVLAGPLSTLPAVITAFFLPKIGGIWLMCGAVISSISMIVYLAATGGGEDFQAIVWGFLKYGALMFGLGIAAYLRKRVTIK